jgi:geranylgeranyl diphosphate synthase type II
MKYSLLAGGKRIRPVLMLMVADVLEVEKNLVMPFALAIEYIHTYSLIHDDLPDMDNDDYRRGKLTNHKVYGNAMAILAGDALLNKAYEIILRNVNNVYSINAGRLLSMYAGSFGMVGGQAYDINSDLYDKNLDTLKLIHDKKCGKLIEACALIPSCFKGDLFFNELKNYGANLGLLFQITDDILDNNSNIEELGKSTLKDVNSNKLTYYTLLGEEGAKKMASDVYNEAVNSVKDIPNSEILVDFATYVLQRRK